MAERGGGLVISRSSSARISPAIPIRDGVIANRKLIDYVWPDVTVGNPKFWLA
jgi:hypothetical protein